MSDLKVESKTQRIVVNPAPQHIVVNAASRTASIISNTVLVASSGPIGPPGIQGLDGPDGPEGPPGPTGDTGVIFQDEPPLDTDKIWVDTNEPSASDLLIGQQRPVFSRMKTSCYRTPLFSSYSSQLTNAFRWYTVIPVEHGDVIDGIAIQVTTGGSTGATVRLALYSDDGSGHPGNLIVDAGNVTVDTTGVKTAVLSSPYSVPLGMSQIWAMCHPDYDASTKPVLRVAIHTLAPNFSFAVSSGSILDTTTAYLSGFHSSVYFSDAPAPASAGSLAADRFTPLTALRLLAL